LQLVLSKRRRGTIRRRSSRRSRRMDERRTSMMARHLLFSFVCADCKLLRVDRVRMLDADVA